MCRRTGLLVLVLVWSVSMLRAENACARQDPAFTDQPPGTPLQAYQILNLRVEGVADEPTRDLVKQASGLRIGQWVRLPADPALAEAVRSVYALRLFDDVRLVANRRIGEEIYLVLVVDPAPRLAAYTFTGISARDAERLRQRAGLRTGGHLLAGDAERARRAVRTYFTSRGYTLADVTVAADTTSDGAVTLTYAVTPGPRLTVEAVNFTGNAALSDARLRKQMTATRPARWWQLGRRVVFDPETYAADLERVTADYRAHGYYDARIVHDTVTVRTDGDPALVISIQVHEGPRYFMRRVTWDGNTVFDDETLRAVLGIKRGDPYDAGRLERRLFGNPSGPDVTGLYLNRGYLRARIVPTLRVVPGDSLDLHVGIVEDAVHTVGIIRVAGNRTTRDAVILREVTTLPGEPFSREAVQQSVRRLLQLNYFAPASLADGPEIRVNDAEDTVDLTYRVKETTRNPLQLGGSFADAGVLLNLGLNVTNFSLRKFVRPKTWDPLPTGDGQQFTLGVQTGGRAYQRYAMSFTEPWFRDRPAPLGVSLSYAHLGDTPFADAGDGTLRSATARVFHERPLPRLGDAVRLSTSLRIQQYDNAAWTTALPDGVSRELVARAALTRDTQNHPLFPTRGARLYLGVEAAPPLPGFTQYLKTRFQTTWNAPLARRLTVGVSTDAGYLASLSGDAVDFQRFVVGGSPFDTQGFDEYFGQDIVYLRGYPAGSVGPRRDGVAVGGTLLHKATAEFRWQAFDTPAAAAVPYLFADAANAWSGFDHYDPTAWFRSAGVGLRLRLPVVGVADLSYGYRFDTFAPLGTHNGRRGWAFQLSLGRFF